MKSELNIPDNQLNLILKALNNTRTIKSAANLLGITDRTIHNKKRQYNIIYDGNRFKVK
jgi:transcriptional regulator with GAF, ATPase, and Fis domain